MASFSCWRCLNRSQFSPSSQLINKTSLQLPTCASSPFSTSSAARAPGSTVVKGVKVLGPPARGEKKSLRIKRKDPPPKTGKPPATGERKAMRKRIVLSNTNALEVQDLRDLTPEMAVDERTVGRMAGLPGEVVDQLRASEAFKTTQQWSLFRRPAMLVREESVKVAKMLTRAGQTKGMVRLVVDGNRGTGKSLMLVHAMATAFVKNWIVLHIPETQELTNAVTEYAPIRDTNPTLYSQNAYTSAWLGQIGKANNNILQHLKLTQEHKLPVPIQSNISLARLCEVGAREPEAAWPFFQAFWTEITAASRPPILLTLDGLSNIMQDSAYRDSDYKLIHAHDLAIVKHFLDLLSGDKDLPNGGAVIAATSRSHAVLSQGMELAITQQEDRQAGNGITMKDPWVKGYDDRSINSLQKMQVLKLKGLTKAEARGLMEYWAASGMLRAVVDDRIVTEKWALAGNGVVGEIERSALKMRI
ncbi:hypothetical protein B7494_g4389 [Chlorociboria aeruginascens]|nr:hypothetical protein B7494_g4389 [Chlorociboria aeruginascens]